MGTCAIDFTKFIMDASGPAVELNHDKRRESRIKKSEKKKSSWGGGRSKFRGGGHGKKKIKRS